MRPRFSILIDMQPARRILVMFLFLTIALSTTDELLGQQISAKISSREAWVGAPLILQVTIYNAQEYQLPDDFEIDGCQVDIAGQPSQASQITIINGRRSVNKSVTINYLIVPERGGEFEIPRLEFEVDGETEVLKPLSFSAVQSETGDLLFAEVEGKKQKVYVGQPLDLKLKIWIKPFVDRQRRIKLTEGNMWSLISEQTSWGIFSDRMQELATSRQRPAAEVVRRKDSNAQAREYYLYEIEATVYPTKPGTIDASDLRLVVNYPLELGRSRDPFDSLFGGSMGRGSLLQQMMNDDMFDSPFSSRMSISKSRPITAKVEIDSTEILPIPTANQPKDYRGAVGKYQIETEVEQTSVAAGDPIILRMSVSGDGPMDLIQAPPLADIESLTEDFQITDQSLAGFVQGKSKFFVTTIRPRNESVQQIPEIPFSYFDPELEEYRTAYSQPIEINVQKAESLQLDAIVSNQKNTATTSDSSAGIGLDLANRNEFSVLTSDKFEIRIWTSIFAIGPALVWLVVATGRLLIFGWNVRAKLRPAKSSILKKVEQATTNQQLSESIQSWISVCSGTPCPMIAHAVGAIRTIGNYDLANDVELLLEDLDRSDPVSSRINNHLVPDSIIKESRNRVKDILIQIEQAFRDARPASRASSKVKKTRTTIATAVRIWIVTTTLVASGFGPSVNLALAQPDRKMTENEETFFTANQIYQDATSIAETDPAVAKNRFKKAAHEYQSLVDQGIRNSHLFVNLANSYYQAGDRAKSILNYRRALWINPFNRQASKNLDYLDQSTTDPNNDSRPPNEQLSNLWNQLLQSKTAIGLVFAILSVLVWPFLILKTLGYRAPRFVWLTLPLIGWCVTGFYWIQPESVNQSAIVMVKNLELRSGDGEEFETIANRQSFDGSLVKVLNQRGDWVELVLDNGIRGWTVADDIEYVQMDQHREN